MHFSKLLMAVGWKMGLAWLDMVRALRRLTGCQLLLVVSHKEALGKAFQGPPGMDLVHIASDIMA